VRILRPLESDGKASISYLLFFGLRFEARRPRVLLPYGSCRMAKGSGPRRVAKSFAAWIQKGSWLTLVGKASRIFGNKVSQWGGSYAPVQFFLSSLQERILENSDYF
jgi:hypothetical protein